MQIGYWEEEKKTWGTRDLVHLWFFLNVDVPLANSSREE